MSTIMAKRFQSEQITFPIYQYTDNNGFKGILESGKMWFTDYRFLNDPSEFEYGMSLAHEALAIAWALRSEDIWFISRIEAMMSRAIFDFGFRFFIASFSRARDDLGQWRSYADDGRGLAIGFAPEMFGIRNSNLGTPQDSAIFGPIIYEGDAALKRNLAAIRLALEHLREARRKYRNILRDTRTRENFEHQLALSLVVNPLVWNALTTKHSAYEHEQEMRLVIMGMNQALAPFVLTRTRNGQKIPYIACSWDLTHDGKIHEIVMGPAATSSVENAVRSLLVDLNLNAASISKSDIPYRAI